MTHFFEQLGTSWGPWLYVLFGFLAFAEAAFLLGMVLPGETALLVGGFLAHEGVLNPWVMLAVAIGCAIAGDTVGYEFGRHFGPRLRRSRLGQWVGEPKWVRGDAFLHRHGGKAVLLGRFTALMRALIPSMAGMARIPYRRVFLPWNVAGGVIWAGACVALGYYFAASLSTIEQYIKWISWPLLGLVVVAIVVLSLRKRRRERAEAARWARARATASPSASTPTA